MLGFVVQRPAQQRQIIDDRLGQVADRPVEIDDYGIEGLGLGGVADRRGDLPAVLDQLGKVAVLQILVQLPLAQLVVAAGLGHEGQVSIHRPRVAQRFENKHLPRRVRRCSSARITWLI